MAASTGHAPQLYSRKVTHPLTVSNLSELRCRYLKGDHITPHDDDVVESYSREDIRQVMTEVGGRPPKTHSTAPWDRKIALILYFNKEWKGSWGGQLVDMKADKKILPLYNSLVLFQVPRMHCVVR